MKWLLLWLPLFVYGQDYPAGQINLAETIDNMVPQEGIPHDEFYENMLQALSSRLDLNTATREQLNTLRLLSNHQVEAILNYRSRIEKFYSVYELQVIPEIDHSSFSRIAPFLTVAQQAERAPFLQRMAGEENKYLVLRWDRTLEKQAGYGDVKSPYEGSADRIYWRIRNSRPGDFSLGITGEKDPGEKIKWDSKTKGMDFLSAHFQIQNRGRLKNLIIGDLGAQFGQGLALGTAFGIGKSAETVTPVRRCNIGFLPFTSRYETGFFRGAAVSFRVSENITFHTLLSRLHNDAISDSVFASSLIASGLHRTAGEIAKQKTLRETNAAGIIQFEKRNLDAGIIFHTTRFGIPVYPGEKVYTPFPFTGNENTNVGAYANYTFSTVALFSEFTKTLRHGHGWVAGLLINLTAKLDMAIHVRNFNQRFYTFYSNAFAESSLPRNETGIYWGWKYQLHKKYSLAAYFDLFQFEGLRYRVYAPSHGYEWLLRFNYAPAKTIKMYVQIREQNKPRNTNESRVYQIAPTILTHYLSNAEYSPHINLKFRTRVQWTTFRQSATSHGALVLQDVSYQLKKFQFTGRLALFDTESYDARIYAYEADVYSAFSWPAYHGSGVRQMLLLEYRFSKKISFWIRWARTQYNDRTEIGSGGELIQGVAKNDFKVQSLIRF